MNLSRALPSWSVFARGRNRTVIPRGFFHFVRLNLGENNLLSQTQRIIAAAIERAIGDPLEVAHSGQAPRESAGRETHTCARAASVTMQPIGTPSRSLKFAMAFLARVTTGFCPVMAVISATAVSRALIFCVASPKPDIHRNLFQPRHLHGVLVTELLHHGRNHFVFIFLFSRAMLFHYYPELPCTAGRYESSCRRLELFARPAPGRCTCRT